MPMFLKPFRSTEMLWLDGILTESLMQLKAVAIIGIKRMDPLGKTNGILQGGLAR